MKRYQKLALTVAVCLGTFMATLDISIVNVALPSIQHELSIDISALQWIVDAYALCLSAFILSSGPLSDRFGRKKIWLSGVTIFTIGSIICAIADNQNSLLIGRIIQGIAAAALIPGALSIITQSFPNEIERIKVIGIWSSISALSLIIGPILGGILVHTVGWSSIFSINIPIGIITCILGYIGIKESSNPHSAALDPLGQILSVIGLGALTYGLIEAGISGWGSTNTLFALSLGIILLGLFVVVENKVERPLLPFSLFKQRSFLNYNLASFVLGFATYSNVFFIAFFLQKGQGWSALETGWRMAPEFIAMAIFSSFFGRISTRFSVYSLMIFGFVLISISSFLLMTIMPHTIYSLMALYLFILGTGMGLATPAISALVMQSIESSRSGMASATMNALRQTGMTIGIALLGTIMLQEAIRYLTQQSRALKLPLSSDDVLSLIYYQTTELTDNSLQELVYQAFSQGFHYAMFGAALSCIFLLAFILFNKQKIAKRKILYS